MAHRELVVKSANRARTKPIIKKCAPMRTRAVIREEFFFIAGFSVNGDDVVASINREATEKWLHPRYTFSADLR